MCGSQHCLRSLATSQGLWLGGSADAANPELLRRKGIRRVLNLAGGEAAGAPIPGVKTMVCSVPLSLLLTCRCTQSVHLKGGLFDLPGPTPNPRWIPMEVFR